jgi:peptidyl-dipeptidase Dcp
MKIQSAKDWLISAGLLIIQGNISAQVNSLPSTNPFYSTSTLPFQAPPFNKIGNADFKPALEDGMKLQLTEIEKIADNPAPPNFDNTLVAMEKSGQVLSRAQHVFNLLTSANTNPELQKLEEEEAPKLAAHNDAIYLNRKLFTRIEVIYNQRNTLKLDAESKRLVEYTYQQFLIAGARLSEAYKTLLKKLNEEEASLKAKFANQLLAATKNGALIISDTIALSGLSDANRDAFAQKATANNLKGKWMISLQNTTQQPVSISLSNRDTRQALFEASWNRAEKNDSNDTRATILRLAQIRIQKANLLGFPDYASWKLQNQMARTPATVDAFLISLALPAVAKSREDAAVLQAQVIKNQDKFKLEAWDWDYYAEQIRREKYDLDDKEVKPYFELNNVLEKGLFYAANQLYGISFKERHDLPVYQKDVRVFEVFDFNNKSLGLFYCDYFKRDNKQGGAWMSNLVDQSYLLGTKPVIYNVCNFNPPSAGQPALMSFDEVRTMFHEFGHALHGFFASQIYPSLSGTKVARDFVEFPSQFNEHWALDPKVFNHYAVHYKTGKLMPEALVTKIKNASSFNQVYKLTEMLAAATLDMQWHSLKTSDSLRDADNFETNALQRTHLDLPEIPSRYRSSYFSHIWQNGYAAGYYAYLWTKMLGEDVYSWFEENGGMTRANGQRLRDMILSRGNTLDYNKMFRDFRGHNPEIKPMLKSYGLPLN